MTGRFQAHRVAAGVTSCCAALLVTALVMLATAGCGNGPAAAPAGHGPAQTPGAGGLPAGAARRVLGADYLAIARAGNHRLEIDFDRLEGRDRAHLAAARADLRDAAATERLFDRRLLALKLPAATERIAQYLVWVNQARARITVAASHSASLHQLHSYERRLAAANKPVEQAVTIIRHQLGLPGPQAS